MPDTAALIAPPASSAQHSGTGFARAERPKPRLPVAQIAARNARTEEAELGRLIAARDRLAILTCEMPHLAPIFLSLEREVELAEAERADDPLTLARAIAARYQHSA